MTSGNGHTAGFAGAMVVAKTQPQEQAFEPRGIEEAMHLAGLLVTSRLLPEGIKTPEAAFAIIATGREMGLTAMQSLRSIHIIKGKPTLSADLVAALVKSRADVCSYFMLVESTDQIATYETQRKGEPKPTRMAFSIEDARRAGLAGGDNWRKYPSAMLRARCITALARAVYPDLAMGIYDPDELHDEPPAPPQAYEVVPEPAKPRVAGDVLFLRLRTSVDSAPTAGDVNAAARIAQKAHANGDLSDTHLEQLKAAVATRRTALTVPAPPHCDPTTVDADHATENC